jgi:hypothetical protein
MSKIGSHIPLSLAEEGGFEEEAQQAVRILTTAPDDAASQSLPLIEHRHALMAQLSNSRLFAIRLYVHLAGNADDVRRTRDQIKARIKEDLPDFPFVP